MATEEFSGPIDYVVFVFDNGADIGPGLQALLERVRTGVTEILDVDLVVRDASGAAQRGSFDELRGVTAVDPSILTGFESDILEEDDLELIAEALGEDQFALAIVYEDRSLATAAQAWIGAGGVELMAGGIDVAELERVLEEGNPA